MIIEYETLIDAKVRKSLCTNCVKKDVSRFLDLILDLNPVKDKSASGFRITALEINVAHECLMCNNVTSR